MSTITRTVNDVLKRAYEVTGLVGENIEMSGYQADLALDLLNLILDSWAAGNAGVPTYTEFSFAMTEGVRDYKFAPETFASPESNVFERNRILELNRVQTQFAGNTSLYPCRVSDENSVEFHEVVTTSQGRPIQCALTRQLSDDTMPVPYSRIRFNVFPDQSYNVFVRCREYIDYQAATQIITAIPASEHLFLSYALGRQLKTIYKSANWGPEQEQMFQELKDSAQSSQDFDLTIDNTDVLNRSGANYTRRLFNG